MSQCLTLLYYQLRLLSAVPFQALSACFFWVMQFFFYLVLLQPMSILSGLQLVGLTWAVMIFSHWLAIAQLITRARIVRMFEISQSCDYDIWLVDLMASWIFYTVAMSPFLVVFCFSQSVSLRALGVVVSVWFTATPVVFLQLYLAHIVSLFMRMGYLISLLLVMPWILPGALLAMWCFSSIFLDVDALSRLSILLGASMLQAVVFYLVIRRVLQLCYCHAMLGNRLG